MSDFAHVVDEIIAKRPELAEVREQIEEEVEMFDGLADQLLGSIDMAREQLPEVLPQVPLDESLRPQVQAEFAHWGIDTTKFARFLGLQTEDDAVKVVQMTLAQDSDSLLWKEAMKTLLLARLRPNTVDILVN